jgi:hypothetical protein
LTRENPDIRCIADPLFYGIEYFGRDRQIRRSGRSVRFLSIGLSDPFYVSNSARFSGLIADALDPEANVGMERNGIG